MFMLRVSGLFICMDMGGIVMSCDSGVMKGVGREEREE